MSDADPRSYPDRPFVAVSAAIVRGDRFLLVRRARPPQLYTLPGGVVEAGETLLEAVKREVQEETGLTIEAAGLAGYREAISRDADRRVARHFIILAFAAVWQGGEVVLNDELSEAHWITREELKSFATTEGLQDIVAAAFAVLDQTSGA
ncbi:MAG TPA: NUDIX hydrolase [Xanthobacteraceae bacterium]|nr:NUDIX hydrolase [Xanthobacteraceae bacterium]